MKMQNAELYLNGATVITPCSRLQQDCPTQRQSWKDQIVPTGSTPSAGENMRASLQLITRRVSDDPVYSAEMSGDHQ